MKMLILAGLALSLAACGQGAPRQENAATPASASSATDYLKRINALPPKQRDLVLYRALDDAGSDCQSVTSSEARAPVGGLPAWTAHCDDGRKWVLILQPNGVLQIASAEGLENPAGGNASAP